MATEQSTASDLPILVAQLCNGIGVLRVIQRSLACRELATDEEVALGWAIGGLQEIYNDLDALREAS